jgi:hypothetical protein
MQLNNLSVTTGKGTPFCKNLLHRIIQNKSVVHLPEGSASPVLTCNHCSFFMLSANIALLANV